MDEETSSPQTSSSPTPAASVPTSSQPTYTTAGTIYNPGSSQRLQPPTRRGRMLKYNPDTAGFSLEKTHRVTLPGVPFNSSLGAVIAQITQTSNQYSPLQQNYDRAVSPINNPDHEPGMSFQAPQTRHGYGSGPLSSPAANNEAPPASIFDGMKGKAAAIDVSSSDDEDDTVNSALMNMTVKSLQNLASYPNPSQKSAQKALLRGARAKAGSNLGGPSRLSTPSTYRNNSPVGGRAPSSDEMSSRLRHALSDPTAFRIFGREARSSARLVTSEAGPSASYQYTAESRFSTPSINSDNTDPNSSTPMTFATSTGAPKPLTAGPPGQRQYRPSTFESTFKALKTLPTDARLVATKAEEGLLSSASFSDMFNDMRMDSQGFTAEDEAFFSTLGSTIRMAGIMSTPSQSPTIKEEEEEYGSLLSPNTLMYLTFHSEPDSRVNMGRPSHWNISSKRSYPAIYEEDKEFLSCFQESEYYGAMDSSLPPGNWQSENWPYSYVNDVWSEPATPMFPQPMDCAGLLTKEATQERLMRVNMRWYSGTGFLGDLYAVSRPATEFSDLPIAKNIYGAVGDGRPTRNNHTARADDGNWLSGNASSKPGNHDIRNDLALLDEVLSRAT
ncbi:hypothetical protein TARUN_317 [Trichoderma arundinaceum]|uniref:Uncharacterized protein n=1 Tax=Trichoderma arundinaceum TaxID=490622 RepID=A0A395P0P1_TRIAR|nr:hypothetical protein TARUN_317 [Trichoderma arundinaceum]